MEDLETARPHNLSYGLFFFCLKYFPIILLRFSANSLLERPSLCRPRPLRIVVLSPLIDFSQCKSHFTRRLLHVSCTGYNGYLISILLVALP